MLVSVVVVPVSTVGPQEVRSVARERTTESARRRAIFLMVFEILSESILAFFW